MRDVLVAFGIVGAVLAAMFAYSGAWPPILVVESGSMMHCDARQPACDRPPEGVPYGRLGTIDPGDIIIQKSVSRRKDVETWAQGGPLHYGKPGDVIIYYPFNNTNATPIIHRAMAWVDVVDSPATGREYHVDWVDGETLVFNATGIYLPELGFDGRAGFSKLRGYRPPISGFVTKGDNAISNDRADQAALRRDDRLAELVQVGWIVGKARGEIPWFGLVKLAVSTKVNQANPVWIRVGNAFAPYDLWTMLGFCLALIVIAPLSIDVVRAWRERRAIRRDLVKAERRRAGAAAQSPAPDAAQDATPFDVP